MTQVEWLEEGFLDERDTRAGHFCAQARSSAHDGAAAARFDFLAGAVFEPWAPPWAREEEALKARVEMEAWVGWWSPGPPRLARRSPSRS